MNDRSVDLSIVIVAWNVRDLVLDCLASIVAEVVSELVDTEVYHWWVTKVTTRHQWARVLVSNGISAENGIKGIYGVAVAVYEAWRQNGFDGARP